MSTDTVLGDLLVVELGARVGAAVCGSVLAQFGATVVCVEDPACRRPDLKWRHRAPLTAGKRSLVPDGSGGRTLLNDLLAASDVIVASTDVDVLRAGLDGVAGPALDAIVCDVTAFGSSGPMAGAGWSDLQIQAITGVLDTTGPADGPPCPIDIPLIEHVAGIYAAGAVLSALRLRRSHGLAQAIEIALYDVGFTLLTSFLPVVLDGSSTAAVTRVGNRQTMVAPWNVYRGRDGWLLLCAGSDEQWRRVCRVIGRDELGRDPVFEKAASRLARVGEVDALIGDWVADKSVDDCVRAFGEALIPCGPVLPIRGAPAERNLEHRGMIRRVHDPVSGREVLVPGSPFRMSRSPGLAPDRIPPPGSDADEIAGLLRPTRVSGPVCTDAPQRPLTGLRVLEIGHYTTAPLAARHLANLGAEVIKIEPPEGEAVRRWPPARNGQGIFFSFQNADKKSVVIDLDTSEGGNQLTELIRTADVLIENLKPGALAKRGFSVERMLASNPRLVICAVSGFGSDSLYRGRPAFDAVIQAMSGLMDVSGSGPIPMKTGPSSADIMGAASAFAAIVAALLYRDKAGEGQFIDLSMQDLGAWSTQCAWNRSSERPSQASIVPAVDGFVVAEQPMFEGTDKDRAQLARGEDRGRVSEQLRAAGIGSAPILSVREVAGAEQTLARQLWFLADADGTSYPLLASPLRLGLTPARVEAPGPRLGRDTDAILSDIGSK